MPAAAFATALEAILAVGGFCGRVLPLEDIQRFKDGDFAAANNQPASHTHTMMLPVAAVLALACLALSMSKSPQFSRVQEGEECRAFSWRIWTGQLHWRWVANGQGWPGPALGTSRTTFLGKRTEERSIRLTDHLLPPNSSGLAPHKTSTDSAITLCDGERDGTIPSPDCLGFFQSQCCYPIEFLWLTALT